MARRPQPAVALVDRLQGLAIHHRDLILASEQVGCFYCFETFAPNEITAWTDAHQTAICPRCGIDAVLPGSGLIGRRVLDQMGAYWFGIDPVVTD